jgi:UDP-GlcNAc:undecaprenyl-phosphate GlcNAc-1-phosphate transferase
MMYAPLIALVGLAAAAGLALTAVVRSLGEHAAALDSAGSAGHAKELRRVPNVGGIAIFATIAGGAGSGLASAFLFRALLARHLPDGVAVHIEGVRAQAPLLGGLLACLTLLHIVGLIDDRRALPPVPKLIAMLVPCVALPLFFEEARLLTAFGVPVSVALTAIWLLVITNALNFLDNMDALAGSVAAVAASVLFVFALISGQWFVAAFAALIIGACVGFLAFNAPPARLFMGDSGSLVLGFSLGALAVLTTYTALPEASASLGVRTIAALLVPVAILAVPIYDCLSVTLIRLSQGRSPLVGDQQHLSHRLRRRGLGPNSVVAVVAGMTLVSGASGIAMAFSPPAVIPVLAIQVLAAVGVIALLERRTSPGDDKNAEP